MDPVLAKIAQLDPFQTYMPQLLAYSAHKELVRMLLGLISA
jgi:hypothetical protein